jgi:hypothetical protein
VAWLGCLGTHALHGSSMVLLLNRACASLHGSKNIPSRCSAFSAPVVHHPLHTMGHCLLYAGLHVLQRQVDTAESWVAGQIAVQAYEGAQRMVGRLALSVCQPAAGMVHAELLQQSLVCNRLACSHYCSTINCAPFATKKMYHREGVSPWGFGTRRGFSKEAM